MANDKKIALVTGGSRGPGKNMAQHLAPQGFQVILTYNRKKEKGLAVVTDLERSGVKAAALAPTTMASASKFRVR